MSEKSSLQAGYLLKQGEYNKVSLSSKTTSLEAGSPSKDLSLCLSLSKRPLPLQPPSLFLSGSNLSLSLSFSLSFFLSFFLSFSLPVSRSSLSNLSQNDSCCDVSTLCSIHLLAVCSSVYLCHCISVWLSDYLCLHLCLSQATSPEITSLKPHDSLFLLSLSFFSLACSKRSLLKQLRLLSCV